MVDAMTNLHKFANSPDRLREHLKIKNKLHGGRARCTKFHACSISDIDARWRQMMCHFHDLLVWNGGQP